VLVILLLLSFIQQIALCDAVVWRGSILTNTSGWYIERSSSNVSFYMDGSANGSISAVEVSPGRWAVGGRHTRYLQIDQNDVRMEERTNAHTGAILSEDQIILDSNIDPDVVINTDKPPGSDIITFDIQEQWPVSLRSQRYLEYFGDGIFSRNFDGNNLDFAGTTFFGSHDLRWFKESRMVLQQTNISVSAVFFGESPRKDTISRVDFMPTRTLVYRSESQADGTTGMRYRQAAMDQKISIKDRVNAAVEGDSVYRGRYQLNLLLNMTSNFPRYHEEEWEWMDCLCQGRTLSPDPHLARTGAADPPAGK